MEPYRPRTLIEVPIHPFDNPFRYSLSRTVGTNCIPNSTKYTLKMVSLYSPPLFDLKHFNFWLVSFLTSAFYFLKTLNTWHLCLKKQITSAWNHQRISYNISNFSLWLNLCWPHTFVCISPYLPSLRSCAAFEKLTRFCLSNTQSSPKSVSIDGIFGTNPFDANMFNPLSLICLNLLCHKIEFVSAPAVAIEFAQLLCRKSVPNLGSPRNNYNVFNSFLVAFTKICFIPPHHPIGLRKLNSFSMQKYNRHHGCLSTAIARLDTNIAYVQNL